MRTEHRILGGDMSLSVPNKMACLYLNFTDKAGFGNNFTTVDNKSTAQSVEGIIVSAMFKSLITRCASTTHELHSSENLVST